MSYRIWLADRYCVEMLDVPYGHYLSCTPGAKWGNVSAGCGIGPGCVFCWTRTLLEPACVRSQFILLELVGLPRQASLEASVLIRVGALLSRT